MEEILNNLVNNSTAYLVVLIPVIKSLVDWAKNTFELKGLYLNVAPMVIALVFTLSLGVYVQGDLVEFALAGILSGLAASGYHDGVETIKGVSNNG